MLLSSYAQIGSLLLSQNLTPIITLGYKLNQVKMVLGLCLVGTEGRSLLVSSPSLQTEATQAIVLHSPWVFIGQITSTFFRQQKQLSVSTLNISMFTLSWPNGSFCEHYTLICLIAVFIYGFSCIYRIEVSVEMQSK